MTTLVGYVTALLTRDPSHEAAPVVVEVYVPAESPGQSTRRFNLESLCEPRELAMVSVLRDALVHHLAVNLSYHGSDELDAVELHLPVRETYSEGQAQGAAGRIRWLSVNESVMSNPQRGQPDAVTVQLEQEPPFILIIERRNEDTKLAQLELLRDAFLNERPVHLSVVPYRVAPGRDGNLRPEVFQNRFLYICQQYP